MTLALVFSPAPSRGEGTTAAPLSATVTTPATPPQQQPTDRKDGSGAAVALAAVGAGIAGLSCMMLMKQAQEAESKSEKNMLMMMAMQQCAQAAQNAANAAQNGKGKESLTSQPVAAQPQLNAQAAPAAKAEEKTADLKLPETPATEEAAAPVAEASTAPAETASGVAPATAFESGLKTPEGKEAVLATGPTSTNPNLIPEARVGFDDSAKPGGAGDVAGAASQFLGMNSGANSGPAANAAGAKDLNALLNAAGERAGKKDNGDSHGEGSGGGGESNGKEGKSGDVDMNAMLAQIMGGGAPGAAGDPVANGVINLKEFAKANPNGEGEGEELPNIFQFASYRYRSLKKEGGLADKKSKPVATNNPVFKAPEFKVPETVAVARQTASLASVTPKALTMKVGGKR